MLSAVASSVAQLTQLPLAPEDAPGPGAPASRTALAAPVRGLALAQAAATSGAGASSRSSGKATAPKASARGASASAGYAKASSRSTSKATSKTTAKSSATAKKPGPLDFLDDPKLSIEQKLLKLLGHLNDKWNKELDAKMKEFKQEGTKAASSTSGGSSSSGGSGLSGFLKKAVSFASKAIPQLGVSLEALKNPTVRGVLSKVAGPALAAAATAMGQPQLAPVALKFGPELVDAAAGAASAVTGDAGRGSGSGGASPAPSSTSSTSKDTATDIGSDRNSNLKLMEIQQLLDRQKEMFSLVSNILRTTHETRMALVQNIR